MHRTITLLIAALFTTYGHVQAASQCADTRAVTMQIHDYVHLPPQSLTRASRLVTQLYGQIGVRTEWFPVLRQGSPRPQPDATREPGHSPIAQVTIIVLTPEMAARGRIPEGTLGLAAVPNVGMGSIAYVIYDRVQRMAALSGTDEMELAGFVMAHEIGHLLLGPGSQGESGLMKGHWDRNDIRQFDVVTPRFSEPEAKTILARLEDVTTVPRAVATTGGGDPVDGCIGDLR